MVCHRACPRLWLIYPVTLYWRAPSWRWEPIWLEPVPVLFMLPQSLWIHMYISTGRQFPWSHPSPPAHTIFLPPLSHRSLSPAWRGFDEDWVHQSLSLSGRCCPVEVLPLLANMPGPGRQTFFQRREVIFSITQLQMLCPAATTYLQDILKQQWHKNYGNNQSMFWLDLKPTPWDQTRTWTC